MARADYIGAPQVYELNQACRLLVDAFGECIYLVGSSLERRDFRDVDVRALLEDEQYARMFPSGGGWKDPLWSLMATSISFWMSKRTGLPVDFQVQQRTAANEEYPSPCLRSALGIFVPRGGEAR